MRQLELNSAQTSWTEIGDLLSTVLVRLIHSLDSLKVPDTYSQKLEVRTSLGWGRGYRDQRDKQKLKAEHITASNRFISIYGVLPNMLFSHVFSVHINC